MHSYAWYTPWHPANLRSRLLNRATMGLFRRYGELALGVEPLVAAADRIIFDSGPELLLLERFKRLAPEAALVYRVSDDLRHSGIHPTVIQAEDEVAPRFDLVSVPCAYIAERFRGLPRVAIQHHGIDKDSSVPGRISCSTSPATARVSGALWMKPGASIAGLSTRPECDRGTTRRPARARRGAPADVAVP